MTYTLFYSKYCFKLEQNNQYMVPQTFASLVSIGYHKAPHALQPMLKSSDSEVGQTIASGAVLHIVCLCFIYIYSTW